MEMEKKVLLQTVKLTSDDRPNPFAKIEPNYPWIRYVLTAAAVASVIGIVILILMLAIPIAMLAIGVQYRHFLYCPIEPRLSLFLIVGGSVSLSWIVLTIVLSVLTMFFAYKRSIISVICVGILSLLVILGQLFSIIWLIVGSVWTFRIRNRVQHIINYPYNLPVYCDKKFYQSTFALIIVIYVLFALQICLRCASSLLRSRRRQP